SLSQQTLDALLEANLVVPKGRRESPGRPTLWGTTPQFLTQFGLQDIRDLPRRDDLLVEPPLPTKAPAPPDGDEAPDAGADGAPAAGAEAVGPGADDREADSGG
ncbi:MAG: SMC-Scp complex subunit ScpB, partial [Rhodospirillales bacterium]|nr:SMC-Scp complex subunit ScpB [Rhodospirillales bacterium]